MPNTKLVVTLGPATDSPETIRKLLESGVDVFRLNASHGTQEEHARRIRWVRSLSEEAGILLDLQGPKLRLGVFEGGGAVLETGGVFTITTEQVTGTKERASTSYADFARDMQPGDRVLLADGAVELRVLDSDGVSVRCRVVSGGAIGDRKGINPPGFRISSPALTEKDRSDLEFGLREGIDLVALSFVRRSADLAVARECLAAVESPPPLIAKIEKPEAWDNLDEILDACDGVMVARGDLGVEVALERVPAMQKAIIHRARLRGKFSITATQMLESMIANPTPTRAEVSDVANAIYDGSDAVMLSAETSIGKYPVEACRMIARVAEETERAIGSQTFPEIPLGPAPRNPEVVARAAYQAARAAAAKAIVVFTVSGASARLVARGRPPVPVYAFTCSRQTALRLSPVYGVFPFVTDLLRSTDEMLAQLDRVLVERGMAKPGDNVVFVAGQPIGITGSTNLMKLHTISDS